MDETTPRAARLGRTVDFSPPSQLPTAQDFLPPQLLTDDIVLVRTYLWDCSHLPDSGRVGYYRLRYGCYRLWDGYRSCPICELKNEVPIITFWDQTDRIIREKRKRLEDMDWDNRRESGRDLHENSTFQGDPYYDGVEQVPLNTTYTLQDFVRPKANPRRANKSAKSTEQAPSTTKENMPSPKCASPENPGLSSTMEHYKAEIVDKLTLNREPGAYTIFSNSALAEDASYAFKPPVVGETEHHGVTPNTEALQDAPFPSGCIRYYRHKDSSVSFFGWSENENKWDFLAILRLYFADLFEACAKDRLSNGGFVNEAGVFMVARAQQELSRLIALIHAEQQRAEVKATFPYSLPVQQTTHEATSELTSRMQALELHKSGSGSFPPASNERTAAASSTAQANPGRQAPLNAYVGSDLQLGTTATNVPRGPSSYSTTSTARSVEPSDREHVSVVSNTGQGLGYRPQTLREMLISQSGNASQSRSFGIAPQNTIGNTGFVPSQKPTMLNKEAFQYNNYYAPTVNLPRTVLHDPYRESHSTGNTNVDAVTAHDDDLRHYKNQTLPRQGFEPRQPLAPIGTPAKPTTTSSEYQSLLGSRNVPAAGKSFHRDNLVNPPPQNFKGPFLTEITGEKTLGYKAPSFTRDEATQAKYEADLQAQWGSGLEEVKRREARILARPITDYRKLSPDTKQHLDSRSLMQIVAERFGEMIDVKKKGGDHFTRYTEPPASAIDSRTIGARSQSLWDVKDAAHAPPSAGLKDPRFNLIPPTPTTPTFGTEPAMLPSGRTPAFQRYLDGDEDVLNHQRLG